MLKASAATPRNVVASYCSQGPSKRYGFALGLSLSLLFGGGCHSSCGRTEPNTEGEKAGPEVKSVRVVDRGLEPRISLRVGRWAGLKYRIRIEANGSFGLAGQQAIHTPMTHMTFFYEVLHGLADPVVKTRQLGREQLISERAVLEDMHAESDVLPPEMLKRWNEGLRLFEGSSVQQLVAEDGEIVEVTTERVAGVDPGPAIKKLFDVGLEIQRRFPLRLPHGEVGVGAKWRFSEKVEVGGVHAMQIADMSLLRIDDEEVAIRFRIRQEAPRQAMAFPQLPHEDTMVESFHGGGHGEIVMDRLTGVLLSAQFSSNARMTASGILDGKRESASYFMGTAAKMTGVILASDSGAQATAPSDAAAVLAALRTRLAEAGHDVAARTELSE